MGLLSLLAAALLALNFSNIDDLSGHKVAVLVGSLIDIQLTENNPDVRLERFNTQSDLMRALEMDKVDCAFSDSTFLLCSSEIKPWMKLAFSGILPADIAAAFNPNSVELCSSFNRYIARIRRSGELAETVKRWSAPDVDNIQPLPFPEGEKILNVAVCGGNIPFTFFSRERFVGIEPEIVEGFAREMGYGVIYHEYEFGAVAAALATSRVDIALVGMCVTPERARTVLFSDPYFHTCNVCVVKEDIEAAGEGFFRRAYDSFYNNIIAQQRYLLILEGLGNTMIMSVLAALFGTLLGAFIAWRSFGPRRKWWHAFLKIYGSIMHGVPLLVLLLIMFYLVFAKTGLSSIAIATVTFTVYLTYACAEIFINGVKSVPVGQKKAAISLGLTPFQAFRHVVFPQMLSYVIPSYEAELVTLVKETAVAGFIAVVDLTKATDIIQSRTFDAFFPLMSGAVIYFIICALIAKGLDFILKKTNRRC